MPPKSPGLTPAAMRLPSYAVWKTVVFALNILAFIFIGLQIRPIFRSLRRVTASDTSRSRPPSW